MINTVWAKIDSIACLILGIVLYVYGFTFDRGLLALIGPFIFLAGIILAFSIIKRTHGKTRAVIPIFLWFLAIFINRVSIRYEFYSEYDFIDPLEGFLLSALIALVAFSITVLYFFKRGSQTG